MSSDVWLSLRQRFSFKLGGVGFIQVTNSCYGEIQKSLNCENKGKTRNKQLPLSLYLHVELIICILAIVIHNSVTMHAHVGMTPYYVDIRK